MLAPGVAMLPSEGGITVYVVQDDHTVTLALSVGDMAGSPPAKRS